MSKIIVEIAGPATDPRINVDTHLGTIDGLTLGEAVALQERLGKAVVKARAAIPQHLGPWQNEQHWGMIRAISGGDRDGSWVVSARETWPTGGSEPSAWRWTFLDGDCGGRAESKQAAMDQADQFLRRMGWSLDGPTAPGRRP